MVATARPLNEATHLVEVEKDFGTLSHRHGAQFGCYRGIVGRS